MRFYTLYLHLNFHFAFMFFVGFSCSILPYILAILFAWIFVGNTTAKNNKTNESCTNDKVIDHQASKTKVAKAYQYQQFFEDFIISVIKPHHIVILNYWRSLRIDIPLKDILLINPIKRGPPQIL